MRYKGERSRPSGGWIWAAAGDGEGGRGVHLGYIDVRDFIFVDPAEHGILQVVYGARITDEFGRITSTACKYNHAEQIFSSWDPNLTSHGQRARRRMSCPVCACVVSACVYACVCMWHTLDNMLSVVVLE